MLKSLSIILFLIFPFLAKAQFITGQVFQEGTDSVVAKASVYYTGSLTGTLSDGNGVFKLPSTTNKTPITVSCIGYFSETISDYAINQPLKVYLKPKAMALNEVVVLSKGGMSRADKVKIFKKEFLGTSVFATNCRILNMDDVSLVYSTKRKTLTAHCNEPIVIENKKLGYTIRYFLDDFIKTEKNTSFSGNFNFSELNDPIHQKEIAQNRRIAYRGSRMQFIRALWTNKLTENGFKIFDALYEPIKVDSVMRENEVRGRFIQLKQRILITYKNNFSKLTYLSQNKPNSYINGTGFYDAGLRWSSFMTSQRIGDLLPFEYEYELGLEDDITQNVVIKPVKAVGTKALPYAFVLMKNIALTPNNRLDQTLVVKKWQIPIHYQIHGTFGKQNDALIVDFFNQLQALTGLEISVAQNDEEANFHILSGGNPTKFKNVLSADALLYLQNPDTDGTFYTCGENGFTNMVQMVNLHRNPPQDVVWAMLQKAILKGFGFFGGLDDQEQSLFYSNLNITPKQIQPFDVQIIQSLYDVKVKSGMKGEELNGLLE